MNNPMFDFSRIIDKNFYLNDPAVVARRLLGKIFIRKTSGHLLAARIVETEAYLSRNDLASHSAPGPTKRNAPMFANGGILYVYMIYGIHYCANIVTEAMGKGSAVLIRAAEPVWGIDEMMINRGYGKNENSTSNIKIKLCSGPGNFAKAFDLTKSNNFARLDGPEIYLLDYAPGPDEKIVSGKRIGIKKSAGLMLRFLIEDSPSISRKNCI